MNRYLFLLILLNIGCSRTSLDIPKNSSNAKSINYDEIIKGEWIIHHSAKLSNNLEYRHFDGPINNIATLNFKEGILINKKTNFDHDTVETRIENYFIKNDTIFFINKYEKSEATPTLTIEYINENEIILRNIKEHFKSELLITPIKKFSQSTIVNKVREFLITNPIEITQIGDSLLTTKMKYDFLNDNCFVSEKYDDILSWKLHDTIISNELFIKFHREIYPIQITHMEGDIIYGIRYGKKNHKIEIRKQTKILSPNKLVGAWELFNTYIFPFNKKNEYSSILISEDIIALNSKNNYKANKTFYYKLSNNNEIMYLYQEEDHNNKFTKDVIYLKDYGNNIAKIKLNLGNKSSYSFLMNSTGKLYMKLKKR